MNERLKYWKCSACEGTGEVVLGYCDQIEKCERCDGTGNALVDGAKRAHERRIAEIRGRSPDA